MSKKYQRLLAEQNIQKRLCKILRPLLGSKNLAKYVQFKREQGLVRIKGKETNPDGLLVLALLDFSTEESRRLFGFPNCWEKKNLDTAVWIKNIPNPTTMIIEQAVGLIGDLVVDLIENSPTINQVVLRKRKTMKIRVMNREEAIRFGRRFLHVCR